MNAHNIGRAFQGVEKSYIFTIVNGITLKRKIQAVANWVEGRQQIEHHIFTDVDLPVVRITITTPNDQEGQ